MRSLLIVSVMFAVVILPIDGSEILVFCLMGSLSHHLAIHPLAVGLAEKGHRVTYLSSMIYPDKDSRIQYVVSNKTLTTMEQILSLVGNEAERLTNATDVFTSTCTSAIQMCQQLYSDPEIKPWIQHSTFDLIILDAINSECAFGLVHKYKAPFILFNPASFLPWHNDLFGLQGESSWIPDFRFNITQPLSFSVRVFNFISTLHVYLYHMSFKYYSELTVALRESLEDPTVPDVYEIYQNVSLVFVNSYFASEYARSLPPFIIPIGGIHCSMKKQPLPHEIETFINENAEHGFVFISFGTAFKPSEKSLHNILLAVRKFKNFGFIFRWNGIFPTERVDNVLFVTWAPQQTLLAHPRIRAFVSHCGMSSIQEAVYYGVPVLAIPSFADQDYNAECLLRLGGARRLELTELDENNFEDSMRDVLMNSTYKDKMAMLRRLYLDRPKDPLDTAVWWTEYVLRHTQMGNDLSLMKPLGIHQYWWQRKLIDVYAFIFVFIAITIGVCFKILQYIVRKLIILKFQSIKEKKIN